jgi:hypothetical protein
LSVKPSSSLCMAPGGLFSLISSNRREEDYGDETFSPEAEKRCNPRVRVGLAVLIPPGDRKVMSENFSLKGCFLPQVDLGSPGSRVTIKIDLPGFGFFALEARIAHKGQNNQGTGWNLFSSTLRPGNTYSNS